VLTPDGAKLGVLNSADATMSVIDPVALQVLATFTVVPSNDAECNVPLNMSPAAASISLDVHTGRLVQHVAISDGIPDTNTMALDETGTKMFLITNSGITIAQLFQAPFSLASANPAMGSQVTQVKLRGCGFLSGSTVLFGTSQAANTYIDSETLTVTVPAISPGPTRITIQNPGGQTYRFDDAFTVQ
jgi:hypothetical protein